MPGINGPLFYRSTMRLQNEAVTSALGEARAYQDQSLTAARAEGLSHKICSDVFKKFKQQITKEFPTETYHVYISLFLDSRRSLFFIDLRDRVKSLIRKDDEESFSRYSLELRQSTIRVRPESRETRASSSVELDTEFQRVKLAIHEAIERPPKNSIPFL